MYTFYANLFAFWHRYAALETAVWANASGAGPGFQAFNHGDRDPVLDGCNRVEKLELVDKVCLQTFRDPGEPHKRRVADGLQYSRAGSRKKIDKQGIQRNLGRGYGD